MLKVFLGVATAVAVLVMSTGPTPTPGKIEIDSPKTTATVTQESQHSEEVKKITRLNIKPSQVVYLTQEINSATVEKAIKDLGNAAKTNKEVFVFINSPGGSVLDGASLMAAIESSKVPVNTVCIKLCASMGFQLLQVGKKRMALDYAILMSHKGAGGAQGPLENMLSLLTMYKSYLDKMDAKVAKRSNMDFNEYKALVYNDFWIDSEDALKKGLIDELVTIEDLTLINSDLELTGKASILKEFNL